VEFAANGELHVTRVVRGLGHGLDEAAVAAANKMRFKRPCETGRQWIQQQSCTWCFNWRTETLEMRTMRKVMTVMNWVVLAVLALAIWAVAQQPASAQQNPPVARRRQDRQRLSRA